MLRKYIPIFKKPDYVRLWTGQTISAFGDAVYHVAFNWLVYQTSSSPLMAGLAIFCASAPYLLFGLIGGVYADRLNRRYLMIVGDIVRGASVAVVPIVGLFCSPSLPLLALVGFVLASVRCFFYPACKSTVADILRDDVERSAGSSLMQTSFHAASVAGMAVGGFMISLFSAPVMYLTPLVSYAISVVFLLGISSIPAEPASKVNSSIAAEIMETVRYVGSMPDLFWSIFLFGACFLFIAGIEDVALPALSDSKWHVGPSGLGIILGTFAVGNFIGSLVLGSMKISRCSVVIFSGWALWGLCCLFMGASPLFALALSFAFMAGAAEAMNDVPMVLLIQSMVPRERMGKVFSLWTTIIFVAQASSGVVVGAMIGNLGAASACGAAGATLMLIAVVGFLATGSKFKKPRTAQVQYA